MTEKTPSAEIIKGPWKQTTNTPTKAQISKAKDLVFCEEISHICLLGILETLVENGIDTNDISFIRDITFVGESIKATILSTHGLKHPIQELIEYTTGFEVDPDKDDSQLDCQINHKAITDMINSYTNIMEPPDDIG